MASVVEMWKTRNSDNVVTERELGEIISAVAKKGVSKADVQEAAALCAYYKTAFTNAAYDDTIKMIQFVDALRKKA